MIWTWPVFTSTFFSLVRVWVRSCIAGRPTAWRAIKWLKKRDHSDSSTHGRTTWMEQVLWIPAWFTEVRKADQEPQRQCFLGVKQRTSSGHWCEFVCDGSRSNSRTGVWDPKCSENNPWLPHRQLLMRMSTENKKGRSIFKASLSREWAAQTNALLKHHINFNVLPRYFSFFFFPSLQNAELQLNTRWCFLSVVLIAPLCAWLLICQQWALESLVARPAPQKALQLFLPTPPR